MSLLTLCQNVSDDTPLASPTAIFGNTDRGARLLLRSAQRAGDSIARYKEGNWSILGREQTFNTAALITTGNLTAGSPVVTGIPSTATLSPTIYAAAGNGIPANTFIKTVDSPSQVTLTNPVTAGNSATAAALTFGQWAYALPADFSRIIQETEWDRGRRWPLIGPRSAAQWQLYKSGLIGVATFQRRWRIKALNVSGREANYFCLDPTPTDNGTPLVFEYMSAGFCQSAAGAVQTAWAADTDTGLIDEGLIELETRWRVLRRLGLSYSEELDEAMGEIAKAYANDGGMPVLDLAPQAATSLIGPYNVPDTGFGGVST